MAAAAETALKWTWEDYVQLEKERQHHALEEIAARRRGRDEERRAAGGDGEQSRRSYRGRPGPRPHLCLSPARCSGPGWQAAGDPSLDLPS